MPSPTFHSPQSKIVSYAIFFSLIKFSRNRNLEVNISHIKSDIRLRKASCDTQLPMCAAINILSLNE